MARFRCHRISQVAQTGVGPRCADCTIDGAGAARQASARRRIDDSTRTPCRCHTQTAIPSVRVTRTADSRSVYVWNGNGLCLLVFNALPRRRQVWTQTSAQFAAFGPLADHITLG
jgi:hypothetical protein